MNISMRCLVANQPKRESCPIYSQIPDSPMFHKFWRRLARKSTAIRKLFERFPRPSEAWALHRELHGTLFPVALSLLNSRTQSRKQAEAQYRRRPQGLEAGSHFLHGVALCVAEHWRSRSFDPYPSSEFACCSRSPVAAAAAMTSNLQFTHSKCRLRRIQKVQFGIFAPDIIVSAPVFAMPIYFLAPDSS
jgi:hypothetical protein